jgi:3-deoxy-D-manno-octulosonic-acid transferase
MHFIYSLVLFLLIPVAMIRLAYLGRTNPDYLKRWPERFGFTPRLDSAREVIWLHAVSVGEILAARPLIEYLQRRYPHYQILVTTVTPTGAAMAAQVYAGTVTHRYFPYDLPFAVANFLKVIRPRVLLILETEIWPNLYRLCRKRDIPLALVNARLSANSLRGYKLLAALARSTLEQLTFIAAQSTGDAQRYVSLGAPREKVMVTGNLKFDVAVSDNVLEQGRTLRSVLSNNRPVWIAASTHVGEEPILLEALKIILARIPESLMIIAPRRQERFQAVTQMFIREGYRTVKYSDRSGYDSGHQVYVLDVFGQLPVYYAAADVAFVGGSLVPSGGHNMLEPACMGLPVIAGRHLFNFAEIAGLLTGTGALFIVGNAEELAHKVVELLSDASLRFTLGEKAKAVVMENQGAVTKLGKLLEGIIPE